MEVPDSCGMVPPPGLGPGRLSAADFESQDVIVKAFYLLLLIVSYKFGISFLQMKLRTRGWIISFHHLCSALD